MQKFSKNLAVWLIIAFLVVALFNLFQNSSNRRALPPAAYSDVLSAIDNGNVKSIQISGKTLTVELLDNRTVTSYAPDDPTLVQRLMAKKVRIVASPDEGEAPTALTILVSWFPLLVVAGLYIFFFRQVVGQLRLVAAQLGEIRQALSHPASQTDQAKADHERPI